METANPTDEGRHYAAPGCRAGELTNMDGVKEIKQTSELDALVESVRGELQRLRNIDAEWRDGEWADKNNAPAFAALAALLARAAAREKELAELRTAVGRLKASVDVHRAEAGRMSKMQSETVEEVYRRESELVAAQKALHAADALADGACGKPEYKDAFALMELALTYRAARARCGGQE